MGRKRGIWGASQQRTCFIRNGFGNQSFAAARRAVQKNACTQGKLGNWRHFMGQKDYQTEGGNKPLGGFTPMVENSFGWRMGSSMVSLMVCS